jgi:hypothetical protein
MALWSSHKHSSSLVHLRRDNTSKMAVFGREFLEIEKNAQKMRRKFESFFIESTARGH